MPQTKFKSVTLAVTFSGAGLKDFDLSPSFGESAAGSNPRTYLSTQIDQNFKNIAVHNLTGLTLVYSIEDDKDNDIDLSALSGDGMVTVPANGFKTQSPKRNINRLRLYLNGAGTIEVELS